MITGTDLLTLGWPQGRVIGLALGVAKDLTPTRSDDEVLALLEQVRAHPERFDAPNTQLQPLAQALLALQVQKAVVAHSRLLALRSRL